jgi:transformation/transcription domain-associated protein
MLTSHVNACLNSLLLLTLRIRSCDPLHHSPRESERGATTDGDVSGSQSSASSSATAARKAAETAAGVVSAAAQLEGCGGDYGGGSSFIEVPGQYVPNTFAWSDIRPCNEVHTKLMRLEPTVQILRRNDQLVRRIGFIGSDGKTYRFLLQCALPYWTRTDERTAQTYYAIDKVLKRNAQSARAYLSVQPHAVIPVAQRLRLVFEPSSRNSAQSVYEHAISGGRTGAEDVCDFFNRSLKKHLSAASDDEEVSLEDKQAIRLRVLNETSAFANVDPAMLLSNISAVLSDTEQVFQFRRMFAQQWAASSLLQFAFSISERSLCRVVFLERSGRILSPDFRVSYNSQGYMESLSLPFRLTPALSNLIGFPILEGRYITSMAIIANAIHGEADIYDSIFKLLMRDDLMAYYTKSMAKSDYKTQETEKHLMDRVTKNVSVVQSRFGECAFGNYTNQDATAQGTEIDHKIRELVRSAQMPEIICMMPANFQGWV